MDLGQTDEGKKESMFPQSNEIAEHFEWDVFISYRRSDGTKVAQWIRNQLLSYKLPKPLRKEQQKKLEPYIDTAYERATEDFFVNSILPALEQSRFLIVVSTPNSLKPKDDGTPNWVVREIDAFNQLSQRTNVLAILAKGDLSDPLPGNLQQRYPHIEIVDLRALSLLRYIWWPRLWYLGDEFLKIVAPLYDIPAEKMPILREEEGRRRRKRMGTITATFFMFITILAGVGFFAWTQREEANRRAELGWILETQSLVSGERVEKRESARDSLMSLKSSAFRDEIQNTVVSLLDKPDLEQVELPSGVDIAKAVLTDQKNMELWSWINFAQARDSGAGIAVSEHDSLITMVLSGAVPFTINIQSGLITSVPQITQPITYPLVISPNGRFVVGRTSFNQVSLLDLDEGLSEPLEENGRALDARYLLFDPTSRFLVATDDNSFSVWSVSPLKLLGHSPQAGQHELSPLGSWGLSFSHDGSLLATSQVVDGGGLVEVNLWSIPECELVATAKIENATHEDSVSFDPFSQLAFYPDGHFLLQALGRQGIARWKLWHPTSQKLEITLDGIIQRGRGAVAVSVSPNGRWLLVVESEESPEVSLWSMDAERKEIVVSSGNPEEGSRDIRHLQWSKNGDYVYWTTGNGINLWRFKKPLSRAVPSSLGFIGRYESPTSILALSRSGRWLITSGRDKQGGLRLFDLQHLNLKEKSLSSSTGPVVFLPGSDKFWILGFSAELWRPSASEPEKTEQLPEFWVSQGAIDSQGHRIATRLGRVIDLEEGSEILSVGSPFDETEFYSFNSGLSPDGSHYLVVRGRRYTEVFQFDLYDIRQQHRVLHVDSLEKVNSLDLAINANRFVLGLEDRGVIYSSTSVNPQRELSGKAGEFDIVSISPDGRLIASGGEAGRVTVWDAENGNKLFTFLDEEVSALLVRNRPPLLISGHTNGSIRLWDLREVKESVSRFMQVSGKMSYR